MKPLKIIVLMMSMGLLFACSGGGNQNTGFCGGSRAISRVQIIDNQSLIKATVLEIRPNERGTVLRLYITESHDINHQISAATVHTEIEAVIGSQILDLNVNDTVTAFVSEVGDECGTAWSVWSVVKMPNATAGVPDTMSVTVSNPSGIVTTTYTEGPYNAQDTSAPDIISYVTGSTITQIQLHSGGTSTQGATSLSLVIGGITPQSYTLGGINPNTYITYDVSSTQHQPYTGIFSSTSGTVTLSSIGDVGANITGDFDAVFTNLTNTSETLRISGTFSVMRDN